MIGISIISEQLKNLGFAETVPIALADRKMKISREKRVRFILLSMKELFFDNIPSYKPSVSRGGITELNRHPLRHSEDKRDIGLRVAIFKGTNAPAPFGRGAPRCSSLNLAASGGSHR
jgi:hypothetical protein